MYIHVAEDILYDVIKLTKVNKERQVQRCLNAGAALELMAITASAPGQSLAFTRPLPVDAGILKWIEI